MFAAIFFYGKVLATTAAGIVFFFFTVQDLMTIVNLWINIMIIFFFSCELMAIKAGRIWPIHLLANMEDKFALGFHGKF